MLGCGTKKLGTREERAIKRRLSLPNKDYSQQNSATHLFVLNKQSFYYHSYNECENLYLKQSSKHPTSVKTKLEILCHSKTAATSHEKHRFFPLQFQFNLPSFVNNLRYMFYNWKSFYFSSYKFIKYI